MSYPQKIKKNGKTYTAFFNEETKKKAYTKARWMRDDGRGAFVKTYGKNNVVYLSKDRKKKR